VASSMALCCASGKQHGTVLCKWQATWHCAVQVASTMTLELQFHNLKHTVACVHNCVFVRVCYRSVSVGDYLTMLSVAEITQRPSR